MWTTASGGSNSMDENAVELRSLRPGEEGLAANVIGSVVAAQGLDLDEEGKSELRELPDAFRRNGGEFWVAVTPDSVIGTVGIRLIGPSSSEWELKWLCLVPHWRGMGLGRMLAEHAIAHARQHKAGRITMESHTACAGVHPLFESLGFKAIESEDWASYEGPYHLRRIFADGAR